MVSAKYLSVYTATAAYQDSLYIEVRPSLIAKIRRADLLVCGGAGLEAGWLSVLLRQVGNNWVMPGKTGNFEAATLVE